MPSGRGHMLCANFIRPNGCHPTSLQSFGSGLCTWHQKRLVVAGGNGSNTDSCPCWHSLAMECSAKSIMMPTGLAVVRCAFAV